MALLSQPHAVHPEVDWFIRVNEALCIACLAADTPSSSVSPGVGGNGGLGQNTSGGGGIRMGVPFAVRNVSFINADVKVVHAVVDNVAVDISSNQVCIS
jgi:hypothetical protein